MDKEPLVSALMITGIEARIPLAKLALQSFLKQTYKRKELVIVNDGKISVTGNQSYPNVREVFVSNQHNLGQLRNISMDLAHSQYQIQWDDDDYSHPYRMQRQIEFLLKNDLEACILRNQIRYDILNTDTVLFGWKEGMFGTILYKYHQHRRYPEWTKAEDEEFWYSFEDRKIIQNHPRLYVRTYHGHNTWHRGNIMDRPSDPSFSIENEEWWADLKEQYKQIKV
jgi:glycosyltransferase involved in cell wall biosynthesis